METSFQSHPASFRDPEGQVLFLNSKLVRVIRGAGVTEYNMLKSSGLYDDLTKKKFLVGHEEVSSTKEEITIAPEIISQISYPHEWSFSQLKDAALLTLDIQLAALNKGMSLKDASAYNIQFKDGKPIFIDTSSFEEYPQGKPWVAYKQFCQHFLAPLALMAKTDIRLNQLFKNYIDGVPLDLASNLLSFGTKFNLGLLIHIHLHANMQRKHAADATNTKKSASVSKTSLMGIIDSLRTTVSKLRLKRIDTEWGDYYNNTNYDQDSFNAKIAMVRDFSQDLNPNTVWDLGANRGVFSRIFSEAGINTVAWDIDPVAVERNYLKIKKTGEKNLYPQLLDLMNPTPGIGWDCMERDGFFERGKKCDLTLSLALIHHIAISNNVPLNKISETFSKLGEYLIIEFVPKGDSQVNILLTTREDIFPDYNVEGFEKAFNEHFEIVKMKAVPGSERTLYLLKRK
jgi:ribosomal protein L11 methylase PrmA